MTEILNYLISYVKTESKTSKFWALIWSADISAFQLGDWNHTNWIIDSLAMYSLRAQFWTHWFISAQIEVREDFVTNACHVWIVVDSLRIMHIFLRMVSVLLDFRCSLAIDARATTKCSCHISQGASLNSILFASFTTQQEHRYTWNEACQQATK